MKTIEIDFEVRKIIYRDKGTGYSILSVKILKHPKEELVPTAEPIVTGYFNAVHKKDEFNASGKWIDTGKNGYTFNVRASTLTFPETEKGMIELIVRFAKGVGKTTATRIVKKFKEDTFNVIVNESEKLSQVERISKKQIESISNSIGKCKDYEDVVLFLSPLGLSHLDIFGIYDELGYSTISLVSDNPYVLCKFKKVKFKTIDLLAKKLNFSPNNAERIKAGILLFIENQMSGRGDMFVYADDVFKKLPKFLKAYGGYKEQGSITSDEIKLGLKSLELTKKITVETTKTGEKALYLRYYNHIENEIVNSLSNIISTSSFDTFYDNAINDFINRYEESTKLKFAEKQKEAVHMAMNNRISILSGGPGTGKSQTINTIINCFKSIKPLGTVELAAPTGRAAKRMSELTGMKAQTIHRLIGLNPSDEIIELKEVEADFLIIDEASMIDAYVFYNLLSVISEKTKILIVGDYQQLPSVGPGLVLRDLIDSNVIETVILNKVFRQKNGSQIIDNAHKVINGDTDLNLDKNKGDFYFIEEDSVNKTSDLIIRSIKRLLETGFKMDDIQVLSFMNIGDLGTVELNRRIQDVFNPRTKSKEEIEIGSQRYFRVGDRVMQTNNNYDLDVFNGDIGKVTDIIRTSNGVKIIVDFKDREVEYGEENISELLLAYATTVHKSQGSEIDVVIMPFNQSLSILNNRNIIYTGLTRAKKRVICIGDKSEFKRGVANTDNTIRNSQIKDKILKYGIDKSSRDVI